MAQVAERLSLAPSVAQRRIAFWIGHGVLADDGHGVIRVLEHTVGGGGGGGADGAGMDEDMDEEEDEEEEDDDDASVYILGMLGNQGALAADVIHSRLALFMQPYQQTLPQLHAVLLRMVEQEQLELHDGLFRRRRA